MVSQHHTHPNHETTDPRTPTPNPPKSPQGRHCGWRNTFHLPVSYDVETVPGLLCPGNDALATKHVPADLVGRRFVVVGACVRCGWREGAGWGVDGWMMGGRDGGVLCVGSGLMMGGKGTPGRLGPIHSFPLPTPPTT